MKTRNRILQRSLLLVMAALLSAIVGSLLTSTPSQAALPAPERVSEVSIFYYPWYATPGHDGHWSHWEQNGRTPPESIGANFYPAAGLYSSADGAVIDAHMQQIAAAGIDTVVVSWWGRGSYEDGVLWQILEPARRLHLKVAAHIEPYKGRNDQSLMVDHNYLYDRGIKDFYIYQAQSGITVHGMRAVADVAGDDRVFGEAANQGSVRSGAFIQWAGEARLNGVYTYDPRGFSPVDFRGICENAHSANMLCMPSVGPGWDATRATKIPGVVGREDGATYDRYWQGALDARADIVTITSFNEWHEGTQIEPASWTQCITPEKYCYSNYNGAYGKQGSEAAYAYLARTLHWSTVAKGRPLTLSQRLSIVSTAMRRNDPAISRIRALNVSKP